jgi:predicted lipoprotein with Yx(FWY)xxD motif
MVLVAPVDGLRLHRRRSDVRQSAARSGGNCCRRTRSTIPNSAIFRTCSFANSKGRTLYMFVPDHQKKVTCHGSCAAVWPPLTVKKGVKPTAGGAARKSLLGLYGRVVSYKRWPLYTYIGDSKPGQANGQAQDLNGGLWYVLSPSGKVIKKH